MRLIIMGAREGIAKSMGIACSLSTVTVTVTRETNARTRDKE